MSPCLEDLGMTRGMLLISLGLGGAIMAGGGTTIVVGTFLRWKWLVDPQRWWAAFFKRLLGNSAFSAFIRSTNYIFGAACMLMGGGLLCSLWPVLTSKCR